MITRPTNWDNVSAYSDRPKIEAGAYECLIKQANVVDVRTGQQLCVLFDIADGEFAGYYDALYKSDDRQDKKWKGVLRIWIPKNDGTPEDERTKSSFKSFTTSVEESNHGYTWNWDEKSLKGKDIGVLFRNEEWEYNGRTGWTAKPFRALSITAVEDGKYTLPKDKPLASSSVAAASSSESIFADLSNDDGALPF